MNDKNQFYEWDQLERYVGRRLEGKYEEAFEKSIREDDFLQTVVEGLEQQLLENKGLSVNALIDEKKKKVWDKLALADAVKSIQNEIPSGLSTSNPFSRFVLNLRSAWQDLQYAQFQYLLGFNFSCVVLILFLCFWIGSSQAPDEASLISQIILPEGFKEW